MKSCWDLPAKKKKKERKKKKKKKKEEEKFLVWCFSSGMDVRMTAVFSLE